jgi:sarcosine oxidase subunit beta
VVADGREIKAHDVVLAAGSWTSALVTQLGVKVPIRARAFQMLLTDQCDPILAPTLAAEERPISLKQLQSGAFYIGGGWPAELDGQTCRVLPESIAASWRTACELVPLLRTRRVVSSHCGIESESFDGVPLIGRLPHMGGVYIACGFSGHGFQLAPAVGAAVAAELIGQDAPELMNLNATRPLEASQNDTAAFVSRSSRLKQS